MHSLIRITLLGACAAAGVGVAVSLALTVAPSESLETARKYVPAEEQPAAPANSIAAQLPPAPPPTVIAAAPPVAQDASTIQSMIDRLQRATDRNSDAVDSVMQNLLRNGLPPNANANANTQQAPLPQPAPQVEPPPPPPAQRAAPEEVDRGIAQVAKGEGDDQLQINAQNADIRQVLEMISAETGINILASKNVTGSITASIVNVDINKALEAILKSTGFVARREGGFVFVGTPADLDDMDKAQDLIRTRVYRPNYVRASDLQQLISPLISQGVGKISVSTAAAQDIPADGTKAGGDSFSGTDVVIVRDFEAVLRQIDQLVAELDVQPRQVSIEAMILSVKLDDEYQFGVDFQLLRDHHNVRLVSGSPLSNLAQLNLNGDGLRFGFLDASTGVFLNALETIGETNVVAAPRLLCLNKQRAEILIGSQLGYVSTTVTENASTQSIEFLEVGTQLRIRPYIFSDGSIRLEVHPELSTGNVTVEAGFTLPQKDVTQVTTNVMCRDGSTVIIGGLIREDLSNNTTQIPFLGSLPYLGPLFRQLDQKTQKHEIIVLVTPRLVCEPAISGEGRQAQMEYAQRQANYADKMSPIAKRHYARHFLRRAYAAWNAGDNLAALRYSNLAVHFDPMNLEATNLRTQVAGTMPQYDNNLHNYLKDGLRPWQRPHHDYTREGYPWSPGNGPMDEPQMQMYDPGVPGHSISLDPGPPPVRKLKP